MPAAIYVCDRDGLIVQYNRRAVDLWGRSPKLGDTEERFCGSYRLFRLDGTPLPHAECPMVDVLRTGAPVMNAKVIIERPDGSRLVALANIDVLRDEGGAVIGAVNCLQDITAINRIEEEERRAREALRRQERQSRELLEALPAAVYTTDAAGRITYYNRAAAKLAGREPTLGSDEWCVTWRLFWPDGRPMPHDQCPMAVALKEDRSVYGEEAIAERPDGTRVPFIPYPVPLHDETGALVGAVNMLVDISERKAWEETLRRSEERLSAELEATQRIQAISSQLIRGNDTAALYEDIVDAAVAIMRSDFASMQMFHPERGARGELHLLASRGFDPEAIEFWEWVRADSGCTCGEALRTGRRAIATDVETCAFMAGTPDRTAYLEAGMYAAQSTPLVSRSGRLLGMISTHWRKPYTPNESELRRFDVLARQAADLIERTLADAALHESREELAHQVADMHRLYDFGRRLLEQDDLDVVMHEVLVAVAGLLNTGKATVQLCDPSGRTLRLVSAIGFGGAFKDKFQVVEASGVTTCAAALNRRERVLVDDLRADCRFTEFAALAAEYGIRAAQSTPLLDKSGAVMAMLTVYFDEPHRPSTRELQLTDLYLETAARHVERKQAESALRQSEGRFRAFVMASSDALYRMSADWREMNHLDGKGFIPDTDEPSAAWLDKYIHPDDQADVTNAVEEAIRTTGIFELEHRIRRVDGTFGWTFSRAIPILGEEDRIVEWFGTAADVTARKRHEEHRELLVNELNHRVKNTLATVQSIAMQSLRGARDTAHAREQFGARLVALSKAHDILTRQNWEGASLSQIVEDAIGPYRAAQKRFTVQGPMVWLSAKQALALAMALHELCTNAVKYGALSDDRGRVKIEWSIAGLNGSRELQMRWSELEGPPVKHHGQSGFGSRLIERGLRQDLSGDVKLEFLATGVVCSINAPLNPAGGRGSPIEIQMV